VRAHWVSRIGSRFGPFFAPFRRRRVGDDDTPRSTTWRARPASDGVIDDEYDSADDGADHDAEHDGDHGKRRPR
jgi:hypothetical protein